MPTLNDIKAHNQRKRMFAKALGLTTRGIQNLMDELLTISIANSDTLSGAIIETWAESNTDSVAYSVLDWEDTEANRIIFIESLLLNLAKLVSNTGAIYSVVAQS